MDAILRLTALLALAAGVAGEAARVIPAAGLALVLGASFCFYLWFLAIARRRPEPLRRRRQ